MKKEYEVLCTIFLILIIGLCLLQVSGVSVSYHHRLTESKDVMDESRIAMSYYLSKLRQNDELGKLKIEDDRILIEENGVSTMIFVEDGRLLESTVISGVEHSVDTAFSIASIDGVDIEMDGEVVEITIEKSGFKRRCSFALRAAYE